MSSLGCMRIKCCLKLSSRGQSFEALAQPGAKHLYILDLPTCLPWTDFSCRYRSLIVANPMVLRGQFSSMQRYWRAWRALCFLSERKLVTRSGVARQGNEGNSLEIGMFSKRDTALITDKRVFGIAKAARWYVSCGIR